MSACMARFCGVFPLFPHTFLRKFRTFVTVLSPSIREHDQRFHYSLPFSSIANGTTLNGGVHVTPTLWNEIVGGDDYRINIFGTLNALQLP